MAVPILKSTSSPESLARAAPRRLEAYLPQSAHVDADWSAKSAWR